MEVDHLLGIEHAFFTVDHGAQGVFQSGGIVGHESLGDVGIRFVYVMGL